MKTEQILDTFLAAVAEWFRTTLGEPTLPQRLGWPAIRSGKNTLILAPTGSGKTLAAFLACLDDLWRQPQLASGVQVLYISPLKALNNDIYRNLQAPLEGIAQTAARRGDALPVITSALRTGDTPPAERRRLLSKPPHVLITTPESLHLILTSKARRILSGIRYCIVDEIHALSTNKRGVFLTLLLERLESLCQKSFVRIGLSATQRPLEEVARFLGGSAPNADGTLQERPVTIVDAGIRKYLDLKVISPVEQFGPLPEKSIWPPIYRLLGDLIRQHRSTLIFANNRRTVERITANLNETEELAKAHHGSVSLDVRRNTEDALKEGRLPAVAATASLELGIDMGAIDLVCQVESPGSVARALQRVGRAGHLVGGTSKGRLIPKTPADLIEQAVLAREMAAGRVEAIHVPTNCLDVLAQQIVAMTAMDSWQPLALYQLVRRAYPYRSLSPEAFEKVLEMVSGRYRWRQGERNPVGLNALQPRISWDRVHNRLLPLPGSQRLALVNGGAIPDTGQYAAYDLAGVRIGELDEEFIYERRVGDTFHLGTNRWRVEKIDVDRVLVSPAEGVPSIAPFWRGEKTSRTWDLGLAIGKCLRTLAERLDDPACLDWLQTEFLLDQDCAKNARSFVRRQIAAGGVVPTDQTIVVEAARDPLGDWQLVILSPWGSRVHLGLRLALEARLRQRLGYTPQCLHHDDGLLIRLTDTDEPVLDLLEGVTAENVENLILGELADSALFALRFRQNAARALLLPRTPPGKRAPLWLQRLRSRDLLQVARREADFPLVTETFRECLNDHLDVPRLQELLREIAQGNVRLAVRRTESPSPIASGLLFAFTGAYMYQYDGAEAVSAQPVALDRNLLEQLIRPEGQPALDPRAIEQVERRLRGAGREPRSSTEMAEWLRRLGDLTADDLHGPMADLLQELEREEVAVQIDIPDRSGKRWILAEEEDNYRLAFGEPSGNPDAVAAAEMILGRFLATHALVSLEDIERRYPFERAWLEKKATEWTRSGQLVATGQATPDDPLRWAVPENLAQVQRGGLALLRRDVRTCKSAQFADFVLHWQRCHPSSRQGERAGLDVALERLEGVALPWQVWQHAALPTRVPGFQRRWLDELISSGEWTWFFEADREEAEGLVTICTRGELARRPPPQLSSPVGLSAEAETVLGLLKRQGASFREEITRDTQLSDRQVRQSVWELLRAQLVSNDRLEVLNEEQPRRDEVASAPSTAPGRRSALLSRRRREALRPEGRWFVLNWGHPDPETQAINQATLLMNRYGVAARELALLDRTMLPWRILYEVLSRMELAGEVRRGYFVEGMSGAQFALPEAIQMMQDLEPASTAAHPSILLQSLDPANVYGSGAPFEVPLNEGSTRSWTRRPGSWLVIRAGKPVLLIEQRGKRMSGAAGASKVELEEALGHLPALAKVEFATRGKGRLTVQTWNDQGVTQSEISEILTRVGFVRDYQNMTYYAAWNGGTGQLST
jgi:ATP-dependent Lhr-like helicase